MAEFAVTFIAILLSACALSWLVYTTIDVVLAERERKKDQKKED